MLSALSDQILPLGTLALTVLGLVVVSVTLKRKTDDTYTDRLEKRVAEVEKRNEALEEKNQMLEGEAINQSRQLAECQDGRERLQYTAFKLYERIDEMSRQIERLENGK